VWKLEFYEIAAIEFSFVYDFFRQFGLFWETTQENTSLPYSTRIFEESFSKSYRQVWPGETQEQSLNLWHGRR